ncbi:hypothetical protein GIX45_05235 [Erwinia sp. CPCC 100877]|nr:hypothetical protein [Erwinia sp. CPCC 100877]
MKKAFTVIGLLLSISLSIFYKFFWLAAYLFSAVVVENLATGENIATIFFAFRPHVLMNSLFCWLILTVLLKGYYTQNVRSFKSNIVSFYDEFLLSRATVIRGMSVLEISYQALAYLPAALVLGLMFGRGLSTALFVLLSYLSANYFFLYVTRVIYFWRFSVKQRRLFNACMMLVILGLAVSFWRLHLVVMLMGGLLSWLGLLLLLVAFASSLWLFLTFKYENDFLLYQQSHTVETGAKWKKFFEPTNEYLNEGLSMQKKLVVTENGSISQLSGSNYLNALLFSRYRSILNKALIYRFSIIGAVMLFIFILSWFDISTYLSTTEVAKTLPLLFFIMYSMSFGKKVVQMVFVNCDVSMLYYPFYREGRTIITGFNYRFKQTLYYNGLLVVGIFSCYLLLHVANGFFLEWRFFVVLLFLLTALAFLFSFHELFVYYILQPFTGDMEVVSPMYKVVSFGFYMIAYFNLRLQLASYLYVIGLSVISLIYVGIGFLLIYKLAPKTFKIKA